MTFPDPALTAVIALGHRVVELERLLEQARRITAHVEAQNAAALALIAGWRRDYRIIHNATVIADIARALGAEPAPQHERRPQGSGASGQPSSGWRGTDSVPVAEPAPAPARPQLLRSRPNVSRLAATVPVPEPDGPDDGRAPAPGGDAQ